MSRIIHLSGKTNDSADCSTVFLMKLGWTLYKKSFIFCFIFSLEAAGMAPLRRISIHQNQGLLLNLKKQVVTMGNIQKKMERLQQHLQYQASDSSIIYLIIFLVGTIKGHCTVIGPTKQGCRKLFRAGRANRAKGASTAPEASRGQRGRIVQKKHFAMFCYYNSLLILAQSKHKNLVRSCPPGQSATGAIPYSGPPSCSLGLIYQF